MNNTQIEIFLTVARTLSFTHAGELLYTSQATISRNISALEDELGFKLFFRNNKSVSLTPCGEIMLEVFDKTINEIKLAIRKAEKNIQEIEGEITIGFLEGQLLNDKLKTAINLLGEKHPRVNIKVLRGTYGELIKLLKTNTVDAIEMYLTIVDTLNKVKYIKVGIVDMPLLVPRNCELSKKRIYSLADFSNFKFIISDDSDNPIARSRLESKCEKAGFSPEIMVAPNVETQLFWVETNKGVTIVNPNHIMLKNSKVKTINVKEYPPEEVVVAWKTDNLSTALKLFLSYLQ